MSLTYDLSEAAEQALDRIEAAMVSQTPLWLAIGENLTASTNQRFVDSTGPDGTPWAPNKAVTIERYLAGRSGTRKRDGSLSKKGATLVANKKPLIGESRRLSTTIFYQATETGVEVGSSAIQAAVMQFGAKAGSLGGGAPWGDIPPREFLGLSEDDQTMIVDTAVAFLRTVSGGA